MPNQALVLDEILTELFFHLNPEEIIALRLVSKQFYRVASSDLLWWRKLHQHFARQLKREKINDTDNTFELFKRFYLAKYKKIPINQRLLFSLAIEHDLDRLKKMLVIEHLKYSSDLLDCIMTTHHQPLFDSVYQLMAVNYQQKKNYIRFNLHSAEVGNYQCDVTLLHWAILCNQPSGVIEDLLTNGCGIEEEMFWYGKPLTIAAKYNYVNLINTLLAHGAQSFYYGSYTVYTVLHIAAASGHLEAVTVLYQHLISTKPEVLSVEHLNDNLYIATQNGHLAVLQFFLEHGADINSRTSLSITPLLTAISHHHLHLVSYLLAQGADVNLVDKFNNLDRPPIVAAAFKSLDMVVLLIAHGANVNAADKKGATALYIAVQENNEELVKLLLSHGADVNSYFHPDRARFTPLTMAASAGYTAIIELLLGHGAPVDYTCGTGGRPLYFSVVEGHVDAARLLLDNDADINKTYDNKTLLAIAIEKGNNDMINLLLTYTKIANFIERNKKIHAEHLQFFHHRKQSSNLTCLDNPRPS